jgi:nucleotide-binding universal stress UspA family protein
MTKKPGFSRILWPTDFSPGAKAALPHAVNLAAGAGAELVVLHVLAIAPMYSVPEATAGFWDEWDKQTRAEAERQLEKLVTQLQKAKLRTRIVLVRGVPFEQILRAAKRLKCDLIVLATHGRTGLRHVLMGSVAENVVRRASCPVLTVRPPKFKS